ncbi:hypothetical protein L1049_002123 [Liquidambar formosana]|uniref:F-box domain-containing protein n=1 Tax=Liquidambar formosana TaxID=63359 RepID=A0AAP0NH60_LIQFO
MLKRGFLLSSTFRCAEEKTTTTAAAADAAEEYDRISALPDEVLHHILSFMHTDTAVRTSILSNRWRHLYKFNPVIDFAPLSFDPRRPVDYNYITQTLNLHRTLKIRKFCVVVRLGWTSLPDIKIWVDFAVARAVRCLRIGLVPFTGSYLELPDSLYTCNTQYIEYMFFSCVDFSPPMSGFMGFASLRTLSLFYSKLTDEVVMEIVSKCLLLEDLTIDKCVGLSTVKIVAPELRLRRFVFRWSFLGEDRIELDVDAPSLVSLKYYGSLSKIRLRKGPCLVEARIFDRGVDETNIGNARALMREISHVKLLGVNSWFPQFVAKQYYA